MAKKFFYVCAGVLMLAGAYAVGANGVQAQVGDQEIVGFSLNSWSPASCAFITKGGDLYKWSSGPAIFIANVFDGAVASGSESLDGVKSQYR